MDHREAKRLLDDWIDGTLPADRAAEVEAHVASCSACRAEAEDLRFLREEAARLPRSIEPGRDLWPGIAAALEGDGDAPERFVHRRRRGGPARSALRILAPAAAVAAAAIALVLLLEESPGERGGRLAGGASAEAPAVDPAAVRIACAVREECRQSDREMRHYLSQPGAESETVLHMRKELAAVARAAEEAREAWLASPEDAFLGRRMAEAYRIKAKMQSELVRVAAIVAAAPSADGPPSRQGRGPAAPARETLRSA